MAYRRFMLHHSIAIPLALTAALFVLMTAASPSQAASTDLPATAEADFGCGMRMNSDATYLARGSRIVGHSELRNNCQLLGFHAAVVATLVNANGQLVAYGMPHRYGIDGRGLCIPFVGCPPTQVRNDYWEDAVDPNKAADASQLLLKEFRAPNSLLESLSQFNTFAQEALKTGKTAAEFYQLIAAAGG